MRGKDRKKRGLERESGVREGKEVAISADDSSCSTGLS